MDRTFAYVRYDQKILCAYLYTRTEMRRLTNVQWFGLAVAVVLVAASMGWIGAVDNSDPTADPNAKCRKSYASQGKKATSEQSATQTELEASARQFLDYCLATPSLASDSRVKNLARIWNRHVLLSDFPGDDSNVLGSFNTISGCLYMRPILEKSRPEQLGIMLHELAHSNGAQHDDAWKDAFLYFINIATTQMGWNVALKCPVVCRSYGICNRSNCENCDYLPNIEACIK